MSCLFIRETHVNATEGYRLGDGHVYETFTDDIGADHGWVSSIASAASSSIFSSGGGIANAA